MRFSTKAEYGLKASVNLAANFPNQKTLRKLSQEEKISFKYLERLIGKLNKNNILKSQRGKNGGYVLARKPDLIKVGEIVEILEGPVVLMRCKFCRTEKECSSSLVWNKLERQIRKTLYSIKLSDLIK